MKKVKIEYYIPKVYSDLSKLTNGSLIDLKYVFPNREDNWLVFYFSPSFLTDIPISTTVSGLRNNGKGFHKFIGQRTSCRLSIEMVTYKDMKILFGNDNLHGGSIHSVYLGVYTYKKINEIVDSRLLLV